MKRHAWLVAVALATSACHGKNPIATLNAQTGSTVRTAQAVRTLAEGSFTLPPALVSTGSGTLISVGSGGLVSTGSGTLVSTGSAGYRLMAVDEVAVAGAGVGIEAINGTGLTPTVRTDKAGHFVVTGSVAAGLYRLEAGAHYGTLVVLGTGSATAPVDVATTLVSAQLLAEHPAGDLRVLPLQAFTATVASVRAALTAADLPAGWTPAAAAATLAGLAAAHPEVQTALTTLHTQESQLEARASAYRADGLATQLGRPAPTVTAAVMAALSANPAASDAEIASAVEAQTTASPGGSTPVAAPSSQAPSSPPSTPSSPTSPSTPTAPSTAPAAPIVASSEGSQGATSNDVGPATAGQGTAASSGATTGGGAPTTDAPTAGGDTPSGTETSPDTGTSAGTPSTSSGSSDSTPAGSASPSPASTSPGSTGSTSSGSASPSSTPSPSPASTSPGSTPSPSPASTSGGSSSGSTGSHSPGGNSGPPVHTNGQGDGSHPGRYYDDRLHAWVEAIKDHLPAHR